MKSISDVVLARIKERRQRRMRVAFIIALAVLWCGGSSLNFWTEYRREQSAKQKDWPTWAAFTTSGNLYVTHPSVTEDGVPVEININGEQWSIVKAKMFSEDIGKSEGKKGSDTLAETFCENKTIVYIDHKSKTELRNSLMHEIFHAGACLHGGDTYWNSEHPTDTNHPGIYHLGEFMTNFVLANKPFMEWFNND